MKTQILINSIHSTKKYYTGRNPKLVKLVPGQNLEVRDTGGSKSSIHNTRTHTQEVVWERLPTGHTLVIPSCWRLWEERKGEVGCGLSLMLQRDKRHSGYEKQRVGKVSASKKWINWSCWGDWPGRKRVCVYVCVGKNECKVRGVMVMPDTSTKTAQVLFLRRQLLLMVMVVVLVASSVLLLLWAKICCTDEVSDRDAWFLLVSPVLCYRRYSYNFVCLSFP